jgi:hypothetical protein
MASLEAREQGIKGSHSRDGDRTPREIDGRAQHVLEFEDFVYLDVQKTGSSTIRQFLKRHGRGAIVRDETHRAVRRKDPRKTYFISCRDPLAQYISLYSYGVGLTPTGAERGQRGTIYAYMKRSGLADVYDGTAEGFSAWMDLMLDPALGRAIFVGRGSQRLLELIGLQSLRFATLNLPSPEQAMANLTSVEDVVKRLINDGLANVVLRTETLSEQLRLMCDGAYGDIITDPDKARRYLETEPARNESIHLRLSPETLSLQMRRRVQHRESLFFEMLGYERYVSEAGNE